MPRLHIVQPGASSRGKNPLPPAPALATSENYPPSALAHWNFLRVNVAPTLTTLYSVLAPGGAAPKAEPSNPLQPRTPAG